MANHFTQKPILKRIKMMKKENKKQWAWVKIILFIPALILLLQAFSRPEVSSDKSKEFKLNNTSLEQVKVFPNDTLLKSSPISISMKVGGEIYFEKEKYSIIDLEKRLKEIRLSWVKENNKLELQVRLEAALKNSYFTLDNETYQLESSILGNESYENIGKFELDLFPSQYDKKIALYFLSIKSNSIDSPDIASYKYDANNINDRDFNTFWGKVSIEGKEFDLTKGKLEILNNSSEYFTAIFNLVLTNGMEVSGKYNGRVAYSDWRKLK